MDWEIVLKILLLLASGLFAIGTTIIIAEDKKRKRIKLMKDKAHLIKILKKGTEKAGIIAEENLKNIREKVGLI